MFEITHPTTAFLAYEKYEKHLQKELESYSVKVIKRLGRLFFVSSEIKGLVWAQNIWLNPIIIEFSSIHDAANKLKSIQRNWALYAYQGENYQHRRAMLIKDKLPHVSAKPIIFPSPLPSSPLGSWTLIDRNLILASAKCSSPFCNGEFNFVESKEPPNRAYLKLWEFFTRLGILPKPASNCLDLGASPGGWTWALSKLGLNVIAIDKAPLNKNILKRPHVHYEKRDGLSYLTSNNFSWVFSDMACPPEKLLKYIQQWLDFSPKTNLVCTIKLTSKTSDNILNSFMSISKSKIIHLFNNKHEVTWFKINSTESTKSII